jgi:hypothetical protein
MSSIWHSKDPEYLDFLNTIRGQQSTEEEIQQYLGEWFVSESDVLSFFDDTTTILCTHREDVNP